MMHLIDIYEFGLNKLILKKPILLIFWAALKLENETQIKKKEI